MNDSLENLFKKKIDEDRFSFEIPPSVTKIETYLTENNEKLHSVILYHDGLPLFIGDQNVISYKKINRGRKVTFDIPTG